MIRRIDETDVNCDCSHCAATIISIVCQYFWEGCFEIFCTFSCYTDSKFSIPIASPLCVSALLTAVPPNSSVLAGSRASPRTVLSPEEYNALLFFVFYVFSLQYCLDKQKRAVNRKQLEANTKTLPPPYCSSTPTAAQPIPSPVAPSVVPPSLLRFSSLERVPVARRFQDLLRKGSRFRGEI